jgi:uncharacterized Ntn-hydrolase superfamily protein
VRLGTYSIIARSVPSGELGVAVQSHWFAVGRVVPWAEPGVGAVATQAFAEPAYGPNALELMREGAGAAEALFELLGRDPGAAVRQVAVIDARGSVAVHTGAECIPEAGDLAGDGFSCQANTMARPGVPEAMGRAHLAAEGPLPGRLLAALAAAEEVGGDIRGRQSAALVVVPPEGERWRRILELRVEDHPDPVAELGRLHRLHRAYDLAEVAERLGNEGRYGEAEAAFREAAGLAPESDELLFWAGLGTAQGGDLELGVERVRRAIEINPGWAELLGRLPQSIAPAAAAVAERIATRPP